MPIRAAESLNADGGLLRLRDLLARVGDTNPVRWLLPFPERSASAQAALVALRARIAGRPDRASVLAAVVRAADHTLPADLAGALATGPHVRTAVPTTEQQAISYGDTHLIGPSIVYQGLSAGAADYPYVVLATERVRRVAAASLLEAMRDDRGRRILGNLGFRTPDGTPGAVLASHPGVDPRSLRYGPPNAGRVRAALRAHDAIRRSSRLLAVLDVSGSMAAAVPGQGGVTRLDLALRALTAGLAVYQDDNVAGLWTFSTSMTPRTDYRQLVPPVSLGAGVDGSSGRGRLMRAIADVRVKPSGGTGLYDTTLAAVRTLQRHWDPRRANSVVLITDGANQDADGISLPRLLATLGAERDPSRPVAVFAVGYGTSADLATLNRITAVTGGGVYAARDPRRIGSVIADAIGRRDCFTGCW